MAYHNMRRKQALGVDMAEGREITEAEGGEAQDQAHVA
jgi:hypothetical protein